MEKLTQAVQSTKGALISAGATSGAGLATWMDWLSDVQGVIATGFGIILTGLLIIKTMIEIFDKLSKKRQARKRHKEGLPCNRDDDKEG